MAKIIRSENLSASADVAILLIPDLCFLDSPAILQPIIPEEYRPRDDHAGEEAAEEKKFLHPSTPNASAIVERTLEGSSSNWQPNSG